MQTEREPWWKSATVYQVYPRSFQDSNGDGIGDIPGIIRRLDYLQELGVDAIWLSPVCRSPQADNGYDVSDYRDIDPMFGTMADFEKLIAEGKQRGIGIILDIVLNHSSDEHPWFLEAKKSRDSLYHDYYYWKDGKPGTPPDDLESVFRGSSWEYVPEIGQYYYHKFAVRQPDLNWENPKVREEIYDIVRFWMDKGVRGFRVDAIDMISKDFPKKITQDGPKLHQFLQEMADHTYRGHDLLTVGETWSATTESAHLYSNPEETEFSMINQFEHMMADYGEDKWDIVPLHLPKLKACLSRWQTALYGTSWNSIFWENHDLPRIVSRWGNDQEYRVVSAKMLATILFGMQGTPFIYEGQEIGMTSVAYDIEDYQDIEIINTYNERIAAGYPKDKMMDAIHYMGRDNARTPMQWDDTPNAGFTGEDVRPWMKINDNYTEINTRQALEDPDSIFYYYKKLIALRKEYEIFRFGQYELLEPEDEDLYIYKRTWQGQTLWVIANFHEKERTFTIPKGKVLIHNYKEETENTLRAYEAMMIVQLDT